MVGAIIEKTLQTNVYKLEVIGLLTVQCLSDSRISGNCSFDICSGCANNCEMSRTVSLAFEVGGVFKLATWQNRQIGPTQTISRFY